MNILLQNLHTHSTFCDGKHTPEQMVHFAIEKGFSSLGFSSHSYSTLPHRRLEDWLPRNIEYRREVERLKKEYSSRLEIFLGLEVDLGSVIDHKDYDYLIGAVHQLRAGEDMFSVDSKIEVAREGIKTHFGGSGMRYAVAYFKQVAELGESGQFDILAHLDLITKFKEMDTLFDESDPRYLSAACDAMDALEGRIPYFEVNTGAISRGYRTAPYPALPLLAELKRRRFGAIVTTDCHDGEWLDCHYRESVDLLREAGFEERYILTKNGFVPIAL